MAVIPSAVSSLAAPSPAPQARSLPLQLRRLTRTGRGSCFGGRGPFWESREVSLRRDASSSRVGSELCLPFRRAVPERPWPDERPGLPGRACPRPRAGRASWRGRPLEPHRLPGTLPCFSLSWPWALSGRGPRVVCSPCEEHAAPHSQLRESRWERLAVLQGKNKKALPETLALKL